MYRKVIIVSVFLCTLLSGCNSPTVKPAPVATAPTYQDDISVTEKERAMLFSPDLELESSSDLQATAACGNAAVIMNPNSTTATRSTFITQQQVNDTYLGSGLYSDTSIRVVMSLNNLKRALIYEYGNTPQPNICWQGINIIGNTASSYDYILTGKVFDIFVTLKGNCCIIASPGKVDWKSIGVNFRYTYDSSRFEALVNVNLLTGWLTRVNKPVSSTNQVLDYPLVGYWRYGGNGSIYNKFSDMVSFKPINAGTYRIQGLEAFGLEGTATQNTSKDS